jgi:antitoxin component YwqK of YwqJK toxin-antitoxin module
MFDGQWLYYEDDGTIVGIGEFRNGTGRQRAWYRNGPIKRIINYKDNVKHGQEIWYRPDGKVEKTLTYKYGELVNPEENP